jgi:hypothetical protein
MKRLTYNNKYFKILDDFSISFSNSAVTFQDLKIDFTKYEDSSFVEHDCSVADIPFKFQEINIVEIGEAPKILFTGFVESVNLNNFNSKTGARELNIVLLSPLKMATKRSVSVIGTYSTEDAIRRVLEPLVNDGFVIKEINGISGQITVNFLLETIEYCMNSICNRKNVFWSINEKKEIFVNSIDYLYGLPSKAISENNSLAEIGTLKIVPKIENIDYANIINFKNFRLFYTSNILQSNYPYITPHKIIKKGDVITFNNPIVIDAETLKNMNDNKEYSEDIIYGFSIGVKNGSTIKLYSIYWDSGVQTTGSITFSDDTTEGEIVLQRDQFYNNLITGFKFNLNSDASWEIFQGISSTALRYTTMRFSFSPEIEKLKGIVSLTGQIEKTIDLNERWFTLSDLISYARNLMVQNSNVVNSLELEFDKNPNLKLGDIVEINAPSLFAIGKFAVKAIRYKYRNEVEQNWNIDLGNAEILDSYIDIFRAPEKQNSNTSYDSVIISEFIEEQIFETHNVEFADG